MYKSFWALALGLPLACQAATNPASVVDPSLITPEAISSSSSSLPDSPDGTSAIAALQSPQVAPAGANPAAHHKIAGSFTASGIYMLQFTKANPTNPTNSNLSMWGFAVTPEINVTKNIGIQADFISLYTQGTYPGQTKLLFAAGPRYTMAPYHHVTPYVFGEGGEMRQSYGHTNGEAHPGVDWNPAATAGIGLQFKAHGAGIDFVPGEWVGRRYDWNGQWESSFMSRIGITFKLFR